MAQGWFGGRCCHLAPSCRNRSAGLVPDISLEFCATEFDGVQLILLFSACETPQSAEIARGTRCHRDGFKSIAAPETVTMTVSPPKSIG